MIHIDINYINKLSVRLNKFQRKGDYLYQFRCPYCGDSKKNPNKARGFFYRKEVDMIYKCHNCGIGRNVFNFLKDYDVELHKQYVVEKFKKNKKTQPVYSFSKPKFSKKIELKLNKLSFFKKINNKKQLNQDDRVVAIGIIINPIFLKKIILTVIFSITEINDI